MAGGGFQIVGSEGTDAVTNVEFFVFAVQTVAASSLVSTNPTGGGGSGTDTPVGGSGTAGSDGNDDLTRTSGNDNVLLLGGATGTSPVRTMT